VLLSPRWAVTQPEPPLPVAYNIVLDVSGSMSYDFNGYGTYDGTNTGSGYTVSNTVRGDVECETPNNPNPLSLPFTDRCSGGVNSAWKNQNERRIYIAKQAILELINRMNPYDTMRVIAFSTTLSGNATASPAWSSDKDTLTTTVINAGKYNNDPYLTNGGTPGAQALSKAAKMFLASNGYTPTAANGQSFKPVVIILSDGVASVFLDGSTNNARDICGSMSSNQAINTADPCQIGTLTNGTLRPISAMIDVANNMKASMPNLSIYAVGLAQAPANGLPKVASTPSMYYQAPQTSDVTPVLDSIQSQLNVSPGNTCTPAGGGQWIDHVDAAHTADSPPFGLPSGTYGSVSLYQDGSNTPVASVPITQDASTGMLTFAASGLPPASYRVQAYLAYKGDDQVSRQYDWMINPNTQQGAASTTVELSSPQQPGETRALDPLYLDLSPSVQVCS
jgi:hypothetical protein